MQFSDQPGIAQNSPPQHDSVNSGFAEHALCVVRSENVSVSHDGNERILLHAGNGRPVGLTRKHIATRPSMNRQSLDTATFGQFQNLYRIDRVSVPAGAYFYRQRDLYGLSDRQKDLLQQRQVPQQVAAASLADNLFGRAAHIDIHNVGAHRLHHGSRIGHALRDPNRRSEWRSAAPTPQNG